MRAAADTYQSTPVAFREERKERPQSYRDWVRQSVIRIRAEANRKGDTNLIKLQLNEFQNVDIYLKDESAHPSGSLKHRLAQSLFLWALCSGRIGPDTTIIECSSGSTAISEAYFAKLLGLKFVAVVPEGTACKKIQQIEFYGGHCEQVPASEISEHACRLAEAENGYFMDQFTYAERASDWRGEDNIAASIFRQMADEECPIPEWIVVGAGTGGTSTTIGRHLSYVRTGNKTKLCVVDPENSVLFDYYCSGDETLRSAMPSRIEGIGRPRVEPSFFPELVDRMMKVPDHASMAALHYLEGLTGRRFGGSTGTNFCGAYRLARELEAAGEKASIVTLICDSGERYFDSYYDAEWLKKHGYGQLDFPACL
ncbi:hypothetical protein HY2_16365 [Hyphomonas pacifica]|nr:PLP-dependent cysteine synthase family protein [Hyphomonas pacifica]KCZ47952.1 hypothetical protein HY2_16365 [Hyphomonas pacifica]